jgi:hypothetical protein
MRCGKSKGRRSEKELRYYFEKILGKLYKNSKFIFDKLTRISSFHSGT